MKFILGVIAILTLASVAFAQEPKQPTPLQQMVLTEQSFSKTAEVKNTRDAFMEFIADDGLLFRPGAVNGKKWMNEHPAPPPPAGKRPLLAWQPAFAGMAAAGDLGFTTGPWEAKGDIKDEKPAGYGHFVTLWKKQSDGNWRFVVDLGISHPESGGPLTIWDVKDNPSSKTVKTVDIASATEALLQRDRAYADEVSKNSLATSFHTFASKDARLYLPDHLPYIGRDLSDKALESRKGEVKYQPIGGDVSRSDDLGYTHGTYERTDPGDSTKVEKGSYVRIWKKQGNVWQIVLDVTNPHPAK
jgi:ketosteroid isomerase-like protein